MKFIAISTKGVSLVEARSAKEVLLASDVLRAIPFKEKVKKIPDIELSHVASDLSMMMRSGIDFSFALDSVIQSKEDNTAIALFHVKQYVAKGEPISQAFERVEVFPEQFVKAVKVGSDRGKLQEVFQYLANYYSAKGNLQGKIGTAMIMPDATFVTAFAALLYMLKSLFPQLRKFAADAGVKHFNTFSSIFMWMSDHFILSAFVVVIILLIYFTKKDAILSHTPKVGTAYRSLIEHLDSYAVASISGLVLSTGMQLVDALKYATQDLKSKKMKEDLEKAIKEIEKGSSINLAFSKKHIPSALRNVAIIGEKSGNMAAMFSKLATSLEENISNDVKVIENVMPIAMVFTVAPIVFLVLLAFYGSYFFIIAQVMQHVAK